MDFTTMTIDQLNERRAAIAAELDQDGADLDALESEARAINEELARRRDAEAQREATRASVANGAGETTKNFENHEREARTMFGIDSIEYRNAWIKSVIGRDMSTEERAALTQAQAVIPTLTVNAVWDRLIQPAELLGRVDVSQFPSYVRFPKVTTNNPATAQAVGATITESSDVIQYVDLTPNEYVKMLTVGADIDHMAIDAVHDWIVNNLVGQIRAKMNGDIIVGSGTNAFTGIAQSVAAGSTAIPATLTKAFLLKAMGSLGANYQNGAVWVMSSAMFYGEVMALTDLNDYIINDGFQFRLFGKDVVLMNEAVISNKENIFYGDPKAYKVNIFKAIEVKRFEKAETTNLQFRGATMADGELIDDAAFVRFARA